MDYVSDDKQNVTTGSALVGDVFQTDVIIILHSILGVKPGRTLPHALEEPFLMLL